MRSNAAAVGARTAASPASNSFDMSYLAVATMEPPIQLCDATRFSGSGPYVVSPKPHAFGEMGQHLSRVSRKMDWPTGGDID